MEPVERDDAAQVDASIAIEIVVMYFIFDKHIIQLNIIISCNCSIVDHFYMFHFISLYASKIPKWPLFPLFHPF